MARIKPPTAKQVFDRINLPAGLYGKETDAEVLVNAQVILTQVVRAASAAIDQVARPYDFPFSNEAIAAAYPDRDDAQVAETKADQEAVVFEWVADETAFKLLREVRVRANSNTGRDPISDQRDAFRESYREQREIALKIIGDIARQTAAGAGAQVDQSKVVVSAAVQGAVAAYSEELGIYGDLVP